MCRRSVFHSVSDLGSTITTCNSRSRSRSSNVRTFKVTITLCQTRSRSQLARQVHHHHLQVNVKATFTKCWTCKVTVIATAAWVLDLYISQRILHSSTIPPPELLPIHAPTNPPPHPPHSSQNSDVLFIMPK
ncbi:hypothetical protein BaRGS_00003377 [Batillaria attramentaria]|uniref:Uncharacterized protein n=1 Tax=Batillaria attramentaria TaxID=370345 RepID=A0ABD0M102_9CAEN